MHLATVCDERFKHGLAVMLETTFRSLPAGVDLCVHIMDMGLSEDTREKVKNLLGVSGARYQTRFYRPDGSEYAVRLFGLLKEQGRCDRMHYCCFSKLPLLDVVAESSDRCIFLDCDIYVNRDIADLYFQDFGREPVKAVLDAASKEKSVRGELPEYALMHLDGRSGYFNAGMFLINLKWWRETGREQSLATTERMWQAFRRQNKFADLHDQGILNVLCYANWEPLPGDWNWQCPCAWAFLEVRKKHVLLAHYLTRPKPWEVPYREDFREFFESLDRTSFGGWRPHTLWAGIRSRLSYLKYKLWKLRHPGK